MKFLKYVIPFSIVAGASPALANEYRMEYMHANDEHQYVLGVDSGHNLLRFGGELEHADHQTALTGNAGVNIAGPLEIVVKPRVEIGYSDAGHLNYGASIAVEHPFNRYVIGEVSYRYRNAFDDPFESSRFGAGVKVPISFNTTLAARYVHDIHNHYDGAQFGVEVHF